MKRSEAAEIVMMLIAAYPTAKATEQTSHVYETMLADLDASVARAAVQRLLATNRWMPTIAEIREACAAQAHGAARTGEEAYAELTQAVRVHGRDYGQGTPKFHDPIIARCIGVWGSWNDLCGSPIDDPGGRARFIELYDELATRERQDLAAGKPLPGGAASTAPAFWLDRPKASGGRAAQQPAAVASIIALAPVAAVVSLRPRPPSRPPSPYAGRKMTAAEIEAALGAEEAAQ